jgi:hypothetical protein
MIVKLDGFGIGLDFNECINGLNSYTIYSYERLILHPQDKRYVLLPYKRTNFNKYIHFELDKSLAENGLICLWNNLNEELSKNNLTLLLSNNNIVFRDELNTITKIIGTNKKIDIIPNSVIGKIYI